MRAIIIVLVVLVTSCQGKDNRQQKAAEAKVFEKVLKSDTTNQVKRIDKQSLKDTIVDVLEYFSDAELPTIYRLGGVAYQPYLLDGKLVKIILDFEGDRETLTESYYLNENEEIFYVKRVYSVYAPPKWEDGTKKVSEEESNYFITEGKVRKSVGDSLVEPFKILDGINKVKQLNKKL